MNPSCNSLNLLELDELLGWAETAKSTPHQSHALDELDKLLNEFNIDSVDRLDQKLMDARPQLNRLLGLHTSENDIRPIHGMTPENRVFSEPRFEICHSQPDNEVPIEGDNEEGHVEDEEEEVELPQVDNNNTPMDEIMKKEYPPELLHNFFGRRNLTDDHSEMSSIPPKHPLSHTPSVCSSVSRYSNSYSSSEKASNYTMFSTQNRKDVYSSMPLVNRCKLPNYNTLQYDCNSLRGSGTLVRNGDSTLRSNGGFSTLRSNGGGTLLRNGDRQTLKSGRKKKKAKFVLCTPVWRAQKNDLSYTLLICICFVY